MDYLFYGGIADGAHCGNLEGKIPGDMPELKLWIKQDEINGGPCGFVATCNANGRPGFHGYQLQEFDMHSAHYVHSKTDIKWHSTVNRNVVAYD